MSQHISLLASLTYCRCFFCAHLDAFCLLFQSSDAWWARQQAGSWSHKEHVFAWSRIVALCWQTLPPSDTMHLNSPYSSQTWLYSPESHGEPRIYSCKYRRATFVLIWPRSTFSSGLSPFMCVCCRVHTVTLWPFPKTRHQIDPDISYKAYANTYKGNTAACSCLDLAAGLTVDADWAFQVVSFCHVPRCLSPLHTSPGFLCLDTAGSRVCDLSFEAGGVSLYFTAHVAAGLPSWLHDTTGCGRRCLRTEQRRANVIVTRGAVSHYCRRRDSLLTHPSILLCQGSLLKMPTSCSFTSLNLNYHQAGNLHPTTHRTSYSDILDIVGHLVLSFLLSSLLSQLGSSHRSLAAVHTKLVLFNWVLRLRVLVPAEVVHS